MYARFCLAIALRCGDCSLVPPNIDDILGIEKSFKLGVLGRDGRLKLDINRLTFSSESMLVGPEGTQDFRVRWFWSSVFGFSNSFGLAVHGDGRRLFGGECSFSSAA